MYTVLMVLHVFITLALIIMILVQRNDSDGLGSLGGGGGGSMSGLMTGRAAANFMTRTTAILATVFILNSLALGIIVAHNRGTGTLAEQLAKDQQTAPAPAKPVTGVVGDTVVPVKPETSTTSPLSIPKADKDKSVPHSDGKSSEVKPADAKKQAPAVPKPE